MLDRCLHVIELILAAFKLWGFFTPKVHNEKGMSKYRTWDRKYHNAFSVPRSSWAGSVLLLSRLIIWKFSCLVSGDSIGAMSFRFYSLSWVCHSVLAIQRMWGQEKTYCQCFLSQCVAESQGFWGKCSFGNSSQQPKHLKITGFVFSKSWWSSSRAFPYLFLSSSATTHFWKILLFTMKKVDFQKIPRSCCLRKHYIGLPNKLKPSGQQTKRFIKKRSVGEDILWNTRACAVTATLLMPYQR